MGAVGAKQPSRKIQTDGRQILGDIKTVQTVQEVLGQISPKKRMSRRTFLGTHAPVVAGKVVTQAARVPLLYQIVAKLYSGVTSLL
jgi:hypothetical protein